MNSSSDSQTGQVLFEQIVTSLHTALNNETFIEKHKDSLTSFVRERVFSFRVLVCFLMTNLQKSIQREIDLFTEAILSDGGNVTDMSSAAFCKARKKLNHTAFQALSGIVVEHFYNSNLPQYWKGHRLVAIDGTDITLPGSPEIQDKFEVFQRRHDGRVVCMARTIAFYDPLNQITLHANIGKVFGSEQRQLWKCLPEMDFKANDILLFDRNFASMLLIACLQQRNIKFCFRLKRNWLITKSLVKSGKQSQLIDIDIPEREYEQARKLGVRLKTTRCRIVRIELKSGETEILLTNLLDEEHYGIAGLKELYAYRWPIEESYKLFKHRLCIENFSGKSVRAVMQDFYIKIFIMNLTAAAVKSVNIALKQRPVKGKYSYQVNYTEAVAKMKKAVVSFFVTNNIGKAILLLFEKLAKRILPIRPNRSFVRHHLSKRRYYMNYKPV